MPQDSRQFSTQGIILTRTDYGEADRIITFITPDRGKVKAMAKSVRRANAKLAGSLELFSVTDITVVQGRGETGTLTSARLAKHYGSIVKDLGRTDAGYLFLKTLNKATEAQTEPVFFELLKAALASLDEAELSLELTELWFKMQLLRLTGHTPNLQTDTRGQKLDAGQTYGFDFERMRFTPKESAEFAAQHIKFLRLGFGNNSPKALQRINGLEKLVKDCQPLIDTVLKSYIDI